MLGHLPPFDGIVDRDGHDAAPVDGTGGRWYGEPTGDIRVLSAILVALHLSMSNGCLICHVNISTWSEFFLLSLSLSLMSNEGEHQISQSVSQSQRG